MAAWLQSGTLLFLLAFSAGGAHAAATQHLCGSDLVDTLYLVCGTSGFSYNPNPKREVDPLQRYFLTKNTYEERTELMVNRGMEQCCHKPCSIFDLENLCN